MVLWLCAKNPLGVRCHNTYDLLYNNSEGKKLNATKKKYGLLKLDNLVYEVYYITFMKAAKIS